MHDARIGGVRRLGMLGSLALAAVGCTDDHAGVADPDAARTFVTRLVRLSPDVTAMNGAEVAASLQAMLHAGQRVVGPGDGKTTLGLVYLAESFAGTGVCAAPACELTAYNAEIPLTQSVRIDGSIALTADTTTVGMQYSEHGTLGSMVWNFGGHLLTTSTPSGSKLDAVFDARGMNLDPLATWAFTIQVEGVVLDAQGCPISGAVASDIGYRDGRVPPPDDPSQSADFQLSGTVELGAGCAAP